MGEPAVWEAKTSDGDYHDNMDSKNFKTYMEKLCQWCSEQSNEKFKRVVFCMDNAKYHCQEYELPGTTEEEKKRTLSNFRVIDLINRILRIQKERPNKDQKAYTEQDLKAKKRKDRQKEERSV